VFLNHKYGCFFSEKSRIAYPKPLYSYLVLDALH